MTTHRAAPNGRDRGVGLWGPDLPGSDAAPRRQRAPRRRRPWAALDVLWGFLALVLSQLLALVIYVAMVVHRGDVGLDRPDAADRVVDALTEVALSGPGLVVGLVSLWVSFVGVPLALTHRKGHRSLAKDFGLVVRRTDVAVGVAVAVAAQVLLLGLVELLGRTSLDLDGADNTSTITDHTGALLLVAVLAATIGAPVTEELFFRGFVLRALLRTTARVDLAPVLAGVTERYRTPVHPARLRWGVVSSVLVSSLFFGVLHAPASTNGESVSTAAFLLLVGQTTFLGVVLALLAVRTARLGASICTHVAFNSISVALVLVAG